MARRTDLGRFIDVGQWSGWFGRGSGVTLIEVKGACREAHLPLRRNRAMEVGNLMKPQLSIAGALFSWGKALVILLAMMVAVLPAQATVYEAEQQRIEQFFPDAQSISEPEGDYQVRTLRKGDEVLGYAFQSINVTNIPAYSGKPINLQVLLDPQGAIKDAYMLEHHEPIVLIGIPEQKVHDFNAHYAGIKVDQRVVVGHSSDSNAVTIDAVTGATVTVMVINEIVMRIPWPWTWD